MALKRFGHGSSLVVRGWRLLKSENDLWLWISIPWLIDLVILIFGWTKGLSLIKGLTESALARWVDQGNWFFDLLYYPILVVLGFGFLIVWLLLVVAVATIVAAPFNALLAEKALQRQGVSTVNTTSISMWLKHAFRMFGVTLGKAIIFALAGLTLFFASFVPGLNIITAYLSMCLFATDVFDYGHEARGLSLKQRVNYFNQVRPEIFGLGATLSLTSLIPGLTLLALPVAVLGATTLIAERAKQVDHVDSR